MERRKNTDRCKLQKTIRNIFTAYKFIVFKMAEDVELSTYLIAMVNSFHGCINFVGSLSMNFENLLYFLKQKKSRTYLHFDVFNDTTDVIKYPIFHLFNKECAA